MASEHNSQVVLRDEFTEHRDVLPHSELLASSTDDMDFCDELKLLGFGAIKEEETNTTVPLPGKYSPIIGSGNVQVTACDPCPNGSTYLGKRHRLASQKFPPHDPIIVNNLLKLTLPKKHEGSRWTRQTSESILRFLKSFAIFAKSSKSTNCGDKCLALQGPRILKCDECLRVFSGLYDRYLKLFIHYKTDHKLKCNTLIGQKWNKQRASLENMVKAWKIDLKYELQTCVDLHQGSLVKQRCECYALRDVKDSFPNEGI